MTTTATLITLLIVGSLFSTTVRATSFVMSTDITLSMTMSSTKGTSSSFKDDKIVLAAKSDAAAFVASRGDIRGVQLEAAFERIRSVLAGQVYSDEQLAAAILVL
ncbi:DUF2388 domain-containing protein [Pseudomonas sp. 6D_7.1_Bac1]|uniref:DUF2388 domain-containing protein n=1 Tax=Pseudomonas sp. 6D_7.1_Bac1 TaxID=2971615 RepID=UPI0021C6EEE1|nr:DUF2388 domain-containing protein [Pseudomonas sp. 6D_7.1_Bac1]MCU1752277.1 DUF2388 domain-containing protein [Pseudomonas sp. 6D_7.1_Bac1]